MPFDQTLNLTGSSGPVTVRFERLPVRTDAGGAARRYAYPDFGSDLIGPVFQDLPFGERAGPPWRRRDTCFACSADLPDTTVSGTTTLTLQLSDLPPFDLVVTAPMHRCTACGSDQIPHDREMEFHISEAMVQAFDAGSVKPG
jgi:hypothetical protein